MALSEVNTENVFDETQAKKGRGRLGDIPKFNPGVEGPELANSLPILMAQRAYLIDLSVKYNGRMRVAELTGVSQNSIYEWMKGIRVMTPTKARSMERTLGETAIRYPTYLKKEWV